MENAIEIAKVMGPFYLVLGLSILIYAKPWTKIMEKWEKDHIALFPLMAMVMILGLIIINLYNVWTWHVWILVTVAGWAMFVKSALYFLLPGTILKWGLSVRKSMLVMYLSGVLAVVFGAVLAYYSYLV